MTGGIYGMLAPYYDLFNGELDYAAWADEIEAALARAGLARGCAVLDLGCGSGILSIIALLLGAEHATAVDIDEGAVKIAIENAEKNNIDLQKFRTMAGNVTCDKF